MSSSLVFTGVGLKDHALGIPPVVYLHGEKSKNDGGGVVKVDVSVRKRSAVFSCLEDEGEDGSGGRRTKEEESTESSSIGAASSSSSSKRDEEEEDGDEAESRKKEGGFGSLDSLEESLPIKRGLSNFFSGKSKSFASLADVATASASDLVKRENPFNKRRRILMAFKARRASYGSLVSFSTSASSSMSSTLLALDQTVEEEEGDGEDAGDDEEEEEEEDDDDDCDDGGDKFSASNPIFSRKNGKKITVMGEGCFRSTRSFSLSDLQHA